MCSGLLSLLSRLIAFCPVLTICQPQWLLSSHIVFPFLTHQVRSLLRFLCTSGLYPHFFALLTPTQLSHCSSCSFFRKAFFDFPQLNEFQMLFYNVLFSFITTIPVFNYIFTWSSFSKGRSRHPGQTSECPCLTCRLCSLGEGAGKVQLMNLKSLGLYAHWENHF